MEAHSDQKAKDKMAIGNPYTPVITLNVNGLNSPIKRNSIVDWIKNKQTNKQQQQKAPKHTLPSGDTSMLQRQS